MEQTPHARTPDAGSPRAGLWAWVVLLVMTAGIVAVNQFTSLAEPEAPAAVETVAPPGLDEFTLVSKIYVKLANTGLVDRGASSAVVREAAGTPLERLRGAMVSLELEDAEAAAKSLSASRKELEAGPALVGLSDDARRRLVDDADLVRRVAAGESLTEGERAGLVERHGWYGRLALSKGLAETDPDREGVVGGGGALIAVFVLLFVLLGVLGVAGLTLFIVALVRLSQGGFRPAFSPPARGGSVYVETVAAFAVVFLLVMKVGLTAAAGAMTPEGGEPPAWLNRAALLSQWLLVAVPLYPLLRGVSWSDLRRQMGWHSGRGVLREMGAGFVAYVAAVPLLGIAFVITLVMLVIYQFVSRELLGGSGEPPPNRVMEVLAGSSPLDAVLLFTLATIWAPLVEESLFRGAMFRHLRGGWRLLPSAVVSALFFGVMHGYPFFMLLPVMTLGFTFAVIREWRGSLVGPMFVHGLHNATVLALALSILGIVRD